MCIRDRTHAGEAVKALVVRVQGVVLSAEEVVEFGSKRLARFKCPTIVEFVERLPHTVTGKVIKASLRDDAAHSPQS